MTFDAETLYNLLPSLYRLRDVERGEPLKALVSVLAREVAVLESDLDRLYDDRFIETCAEWVIPYIGDLIGDRPIYSNLPGLTNSRAVVANTIGYRRRKGTAVMLEQLARDVTGWSARVVEFFELLATTQYLNHLRPHNLATPDLRNWQALEYLQSPFTTVARTIDVRRIAPKRGRYNIPNVGLFLWRLRPYTIGQSTDTPTEEDTAKPLGWGTARQAALPEAGLYTFNPLGIDAPLFNPSRPETNFTLAEPINIPEPLRRRVLYEELEARRQAIANDNLESHQPLYFPNAGDNGSTDPRQNVFDLFVAIDGDEILIPPKEILICNLTAWQRPPTNKTYLTPQLDPQLDPIAVAVDPLLGRIAFPEGVIPQQVKVRYSYGFSSELGGGPYDRSDSVLPLLEQTVTWQRGVSQNAEPGDEYFSASLSEAIAQWNENPSDFGIIAIVDNHSYIEDFPPIEIPQGSQLLIVGAGWAKVTVPDSPTPQPQLGQLSPEFIRPHLSGNLIITSPPEAAEGNNPGRLLLDGLLIEGQLRVTAGSLGRLNLAHCTLVLNDDSEPPQKALAIEPGNELLEIQLKHAITGAIDAANIARLEIVNSLIDGAWDLALNASGTKVEIQTTTIIGSSSCRSLAASNSIFTQTVVAERRQTGCVRFSSLPLDSLVPRRYRCQPDLALAELAQELNLPAIDDPERQTQIARKLAPQFTTLQYGNPAYGQLSQRCAIEIRQGADDEAEMGVFHDLYQPQRETNLRVRLDEYLRFSLEAGILYVT